MNVEELTGRELDKAIAERVFDIVEFRLDELLVHWQKVPAAGGYWSRLPFYSTDPTACAMLKKKLIELGNDIEIRYFGGNLVPKRWRCWIEPQSVGDWAETEELAVCRAALKAVTG